MMRRMAHVMVATAVASFGLVVAAETTAHADPLPTVTTWCSGGNLYIRTSNGGTGVIYRSSQCRA